MGTSRNNNKRRWLKKTIELNRYTFDEDGKATEQGEKVIETYYTEGTSNGNAIAKSITDFKTSVSQNGGYYIGRYEARTEDERKRPTNPLTTMTEKVTENVYIWVTQSQAAKLSQEMYNNTKFTSDLINSYAWDTAILFLQKCGTNAKYSRQNRINTELEMTGTTNDVQCNIYDMAGNIREWTTETSNDSAKQCTVRGGYCLGVNYYTCRRLNSSTESCSDYIGFRPILYIQTQNT